MHWQFLEMSFKDCTMCYKDSKHNTTVLYKMYNNLNLQRSEKKPI